MWKNILKSRLRAVKHRNEIRVKINQARKEMLASGYEPPVFDPDTRQMETRSGLAEDERFNNPIPTPAGASYVATPATRGRRNYGPQQKATRAAKKRIKAEAKAVAQGLVKGKFKGKEKGKGKGQEQAKPYGQQVFR